MIKSKNNAGSLSPCKVERTTRKNILSGKTEKSNALKSIGGLGSWKDSTPGFKTMNRSTIRGGETSCK